MLARLRALLFSSLVGRLVLAQMALVLLLWGAACAYLVHDTARYDEILEPRLASPRADMILAVVDALADQPDKLAAALLRIDVFQRRESNEEDDPALRQAMVVWKGDKVVYASPGEPGVLRTLKNRQLEKLEVDGTPWRTYSQASEVSDARVTLIRSGHTMKILFALGSRGILILPLLISLPFLVLPAWLSVRLALRPWRRFSEEIAARGPDDLAPLQFGSGYRELQPLSRAVNQLLARVAASLERERSFIADAAHEMRTPLAAMRINVEALRNHRSDPRDQELLDGLVRSNARTSRLVAQLLGLMRSDAARPNARVRLSLAELVQERLAALSGLARQSRIELELRAHTEGMVDGEREGLTSLIDNLVENAIKYSPAGSRVELGLIEQGAEVLMWVEDTGPGIPEDLHERVFDRFFRVPDQTQAGSGLGLAIVKAVADRHGVALRLSRGVDGQGLRVELRFPLAA